MVVIGFREIYKMKDIDKDAVLKACNQSSCRICFNVYRDQLPKQKNPNYYGTINLPFRLCIFPWDLFPNKHPNKTGHVWRFIKTEEEFNKIKNWCSERMRYVYLRDCLSVSAALGFNKPSNDTPDYTEVGHLICQSKRVSNEDAISRLIEITLEFIDKHAIYKECAYVAAVPPNPNKSYDLPSTLVTWISEKLSLPDITSGFVFGGHKTSAKDIQNDDPDFFDKKWGIWGKTPN